jgi:XTP/dITP diphosphohydrolase
MPVVEQDDLLFVTGNDYKFQEADRIADEFGIRVVRCDQPSLEVQEEDLHELVRHKARDAHRALLRPLFVEHTSLHIDYLDGFPGGYTKAFLQRLTDAKICELFGVADRCAASGRTVIGYCDGRTIRTYEADVRGRIVPAPAGAAGGWSGFGWNRVFAPEPGDETFAQMGENRKNEMSMRRNALHRLFQDVKADRRGR